MARKNADKKTTARSTPSRYTTAQNKSKPADVKSPQTPAANQPSIDTAAVAAYVGALRDSNADLARDAALALGTTGNSSAVEPLIAALNNPDGYYHSVVRAAAAASLARIGDSRALEPLISTVRDCIAEPSVEAIRALGILGNSRAIPTLLEVVRNADGFFLPVARRAAITSLANFRGEPSVAAELTAVSANSAEDSVIRQSAADALRPSATTPRTPR